MFRFQKNLKGTLKEIKIQTEETEQTLEPNSDMTEILELQQVEFKIISINILRALMKKVENTQEEIGNVSRDIENLRRD